MPWYTDTNGQKYYLPSVWVKEELPTFHEMWEFYQKKNFIYDPKIDTEMDHYWQIPEQLYRISIMCNQFNKMLFEDGYKDRIIDALMSDEVYIKEWKDHLPIIDVRAVILTYDKNNRPVTVNNKNREFQWDKIPSIYSIPFANGKLNPFILTSDVTRINVNEIVENKAILIVCATFIDRQATGVLHDSEEYKYDGPFEILMKEVREYYENGIGWKDKDGNLLQSVKNILHNRTDPAL